MTPEEAATLHARAMQVPRPWTAAEFGALLASPGVFVVGSPGAMAMGRVAADEAELLTIATAPERRRQGLARRTLAAFEEEAVLRGARSGFLEVAADNAAAHALYTGAGWTVAGRRRGYYRSADGSRIDALVMTKTFDFA